VTLTTDSLQLRDRNDRLKREIRFEDVTELHITAGMSAQDEQNRSFPISMARIVPRRGRSISFQSSYFVRTGSRSPVARNHSDSFESLLRELKRRVRLANPEAVQIVGSRMVSLMGYFVSGLSVLVFVLTLAALVYAFWHPSRSVMSVVLCPIFGLWFFHMGQAYAPEREPL